MLAPVCLSVYTADKQDTSTETRTWISCPESTYSTSRISRRVFARSRVVSSSWPSSQHSPRRLSCELLLVFSFLLSSPQEKNIGRRGKSGQGVSSFFLRSFLFSHLHLFFLFLTFSFFSIMLNALVHGRAACPAFTSCFVFLIPPCNNFNRDRVSVDDGARKGYKENRSKRKKNQKTQMQTFQLDKPNKSRDLHAVQCSRSKKKKKIAKGHGSQEIQPVLNE